MEIKNIRNITISGRIGSGAKTLAKKLSETLGWQMLDGGKLFRKINQEIGASVVDTGKRPDHFDLEYEGRIKKMLREENHHISQSHLAGFDAQGIEGVYKILILTEDSDGNDKTDVRIDRLVNRDGISIEQAKYEVNEREKQNLDKWRRLYASGNQNWVNWDKNNYDLTIIIYSHNQEHTLKIVLDTLGIR